MRNCIIIDTFTSVDIVEIVRCGSIVLEVSERFFCQNSENNPHTDFVNEMFQKEIYSHHKVKKYCRTQLKR